MEGKAKIKDSWKNLAKRSIVQKAMFAGEVVLVVVFFGGGRVY